jgi:DNA polymerase/3'-5' exonuclease PolX
VTALPQSWPLERARRIAEMLAEALSPVCDRLEIAGSIRRRVERVKDIELVARPKGIQVDLLGYPRVDEMNDLERRIAGMLEDGKLVAREPRRLGKRYKALELGPPRAAMAIDLFIVLPPAEFGALHAIRTGPAEYSKMLVTACQRRGLRCVEGRLVDAKGRTVETPTEFDFFRECGVAWIQPEERRG